MNCSKLKKMKRKDMKTVDDLVKQHETDLIEASKVLTDLMVKFGINNLSFKAEYVSPTNIKISWELKR